LIPSVKKRFCTYGMSSQADFQASEVSFEGLKSRYSLYHHDRLLGQILLNLPGIHNVYNSLASVAVGFELDIDFDTIKRALETIQGVQRRIEIKGEARGVIVVDDYGHHPTEIKTTLQAVKECWPDRRKVVIFQPHRYTRTQALFDEFTRAFNQSDVLVVLPIYAASEKPIAGVTARALCERIHAHGHRDVIYLSGLDECVDYLEGRLKSGDLLLTLGAGNVLKVGDMLLSRWQPAMPKKPPEEQKPAFGPGTGS
jgi:UDP-N-acetylmuramate--alanine ligase